MSLIQSSGYQKRDLLEPLLYSMDIQADLNLACRFCRALVQSRKVQKMPQNATITDRSQYPIPRGGANVQETLQLEYGYAHERRQS